MFAICGPAGPAGPAFALAQRWTSSSSCAAVMVMRLKLFVACVSGGAIVRSGIGLTGGLRGLVNEAKNSVAWLLCLSGLGSNTEVTPPSGSGVSSLLVKASMLLPAAWSRARRSLRLSSASWSKSVRDFVITDPFFVASLGGNRYCDDVFGLSGSLSTLGTTMLILPV